MAHAPKDYLYRSRFRLFAAWWMCRNARSYRPMALRYWQDRWYVVNYYGN